MADGVDPLHSHIGDAEHRQSPERSRPTRVIASPAGPLYGQCRLPGDKSVSHRAIIMAALAEGTSTLNGLADSEDVERTLAAVEAFGARIETQGSLTHISGCRWQSPDRPIDCGNSGTAARLLIGAAAAIPGLKASFVGDESLMKRPMARLVAPLVRMGAKIDYGGHSLPIKIVGRRLVAITHRNVPPSAQVKTALLLAGLQAHGITRIIEPERTRTHGEVMLRYFGCGLETVNFGGSYGVSLYGPQELKPVRIDIGGDPSSAAFPIVAGLIVPGSAVRIDNMLASPERLGLFDVLTAMGADLKIHAREALSGEAFASVSCRHSRLHGVDVPGTIAPAMIDEYPIAAVAAAFADGTTIFRGIGELRHKESDRLERIAAGLMACGVAARIHGDDLVVVGNGPPQGDIQIDSHGDHRIAMAFAVLGLAGQGMVTVRQADMIATSFPGFAKLMNGLGAGLKWAP
jgi:3-phosphoshikimate 1-carboxyvinyltransferase